MSVSFNRAQLVKVATEALAAHDKARTEYDKAVAKYKASHAAAEAATTRARARTLRDGLTRLLKSQGPIRASDVRVLNGDSYSVNERFYREPYDSTVRDNVTAPNGLLSPAQVTETKALLKVLAAATGDTVSANELTETLERPDTTPADTTSDQPPDKFHYVKKGAIVESVVEGTHVVALCGEVFPVRKSAPPGAPVCPDCERIYKTIKP